MFGPETTFLLAASDSQCGYSLLLPLDSNTTSRVSVAIAAMNYSVEILSAPNPLYSNTSCFCAKSKGVIEYLTDASSTSQNITILEANTTLCEVTFIYKSGVCMEVVGTELFPTAEGAVSEVDGITYSCFPSSATFLSKGQSWPLKVLLFERYPADPTWIDAAAQSVLISKSSGIAMVVDREVPNAEVFIHDAVTGITKDQFFTYNSTVGLGYLINASKPMPSPPFDYSLAIGALRNGSDGLSFTSFTWYLPVIGVLPKELPNFYPLASNPDLIFMVLRDPPGGASYSTIAAGSTIDFALEVEGSHTYDSTIDFNSDVEVGFEKKEDVAIAPLGFGVSDEALELEVGGQVHYGHHFTASSTRASTTHYEYSFYFEYDFSTSEDPNIAGHPSDVIIGGGVDLIVNEAIEGKNQSKL
jgi:hypothetical protein